MAKTDAIVVKGATLQDVIDAVDAGYPGCGAVAERLFGKFLSIYPGRQDLIDSLFICTTCMEGSVGAGDGEDPVLIMIADKCCDCAGCHIRPDGTLDHADHPAWDRFIAVMLDRQRRAREGKVN